MKNPNFDLFTDVIPELATPWREMTIEMAMNCQLDKKTLMFFMIALTTAKQDWPMLRQYLWMAQSNGATRQEIMDSLKVTIPTWGPLPLMANLENIMTWLDENMPEAK